MAAVYTKPSPNIELLKQTAVDEVLLEDINDLDVAESAQGGYGAGGVLGDVIGGLLGGGGGLLGLGGQRGYGGYNGGYEGRRFGEGGGRYGGYGGYSGEGGGYGGKLYFILSSS